MERNVIISFSPTFTDKIPFVPVPLSGTVDLILERLLKGTPFTYKRINSSRYFIYKKKKLPAPEVVSLRPEKKAVPLLLPPPAEKKLLPLPEKNVLLVTPAPL
ncbi:MAG: STN domain-containing protein [Fibrobacter sp.]|nr:STN domain-containing protein [Fibrobacter sp.]